MQQYTLSPNNFLVQSDGFSGFVSFLIKDAKRKKKELEQECFDITYRTFLRKMQVFYRSKKIEDEKILFYLLSAVVDYKKGMMVDNKNFSKK